jgi:DNA-binding transcriptional MerR regulator/methylmalonyl-CoA mutase cobalamin-binding subunit
MGSSHHAINAVVRRTGLSAHVIRVWEKRYGAVEPHRTATNRRLYSDEQVERLELLRDATKAGQSIGAVAKLPGDTLRQMVAAVPARERQAKPALTVSPTGPSMLDDALDAVRALDVSALEGVLTRADYTLGTQGMLQRVAAPLAQALGALWRDGTITAAHEHFATAVLRTYLSRSALPFGSSGNEPVLIVATPAGQLHELGALLVGASAANLGWHVIYLGASLPAPEIASAARQRHARAVALSLVHPDNDPRLDGELTRLRELLPADVAIIAGGRATSAYAKTLAQIGAVQASDLTQLLSALDACRAADREVHG